MSTDQAILTLLDRVQRIKCSECHKDIDVSGVQPLTTTTCPSCGFDELPVPGLLGNFVLIKSMGTGAMGAVYQGFDQTLKRHVAIKVMLSELNEDQQFAENFLREARVLASLNHPNVVQVYTCGREKGQPYIVMELVAGTRLDSLMKGKKLIDETYLLEICRGVVLGLNAAHDVGLVHGDVKPENILLDRKGKPKVVDFGLARQASKKGEIAEVWGTPYYIAPEKARKEKEDHRADIYSLGATMYHALTGEPPFDGETPRDVVLDRLNRPPTDIREVRPDLHPETARLIHRMLEVDLIRRYPTYESMKSDLEAAITASKTKLDSGRHTAGKPKNRIARVLISLVLVGTVTVAGLLLSKKKDVEEAEARKRMVYVRNDNDRLVKVELDRDELPRPAVAGHPQALFTTATGEGADTMVRAGSFVSMNYGKDPLLTVHSGRQADQWAKVYMRFDLNLINTYKTEEVFLMLTLAEPVSNPGAAYTLQLWGTELSGKRRTWEEGESVKNERFSGPITFSIAPSNDTRTPDRLAKPARLLAEVPIKGSMQATGSR